MSGADAFVVGPELMVPGADGPLNDRTFAAKELFDVIGLPTGCGNPTRRAETPPATSNAWIVDALLAAGADLMGTTVTDELAFSLSGTNVHDGTPAHPIDSSRVPGGSSAGSASAVARGLVDIGIGTDTGGSIRVPASYCGIVGLRPTHGRVPTDGLVPLAPSFDTVGLLTRDIETLRAAWAACASGLEQPTGSATMSKMVIADDLFERLDPSADTRVQLVTAATEIAAHNDLELEHLDLADLVGIDLDDLLGAFRALQMREVWDTHGAWITDRAPAMGPGITARFAMAEAVTDGEVDAARPIRKQCASALRELTSQGVVIAQPAASGTAPPIDQVADAKNAMRHRTLVLTTPAGLAGLPVLTIPAATVGALPVGLALVGQANDEAALVDLPPPQGPSPQGQGPTTSG